MQKLLRTLRLVAASRDDCKHCRSAPCVAYWLLDTQQVIGGMHQETYGRIMRGIVRARRRRRAPSRLVQPQHDAVWVRVPSGWILGNADPVAGMCSGSEACSSESDEGSDGEALLEAARNDDMCM